MSSSSDLAAIDAMGLRDLMATGEIGPTEAIDAAADRLEAWNPLLNAVIHPSLDRARQQARELSGAGPLSGVPFAVKDLGCAQAGEPHHAGTRFLRDKGWRATSDSYLWQRFNRAGLISLGRTNAPEFGSMITTEPLSYGPTHNPWDLDRTPGGSSGGSAALVAARVVPMAHGNDGGGSLRVPAAMCGLVGLKVSRGRISVGPDAGTSLGGFAVDGVVTRSVRDTALALDIMAGPEPGDPYTAAVPSNPFRHEPGKEVGRLQIGMIKGRVEPAVSKAVLRTAALLESLGHNVVGDAHPLGWFDPEVTDQTIVIRSIGMARTISRWESVLGRELGDDDIEPQNLYAAELGNALSGTYFLEATDWLHAWSRRALGWWVDFDLLLSPVVGASTPELGFLSDPEIGQRRLGDLLGFVDQANVSGQPAISLPLATDDDAMPIGIQLIAGPQREDLLLRVASQLEEVAPWSDRYPELPVSGKR